MPRVASLKMLTSRRCAKLLQSRKPYGEWIARGYKQMQALLLQFTQFPLGKKKKKSKCVKKTALQRSFLHMSKTTAFRIKFWVLQLSCQDKFAIDKLNFLFTSINFFSI